MPNSGTPAMSASRPRCRWSETPSRTRFRRSVGHAASYPEPLPQYYTVCRAHPNVYLDLCGSTMWRGLLEQMVAGAGVDRVLFGSDIPFVDPRGQLGRVAFAHLPDDALRLV